MSHPPEHAPGPPEGLARLQKRFADHIRDPGRAPPPEGIEDRRLAIYRRLFFNNLSNLFGKNFRAIRKLMPEEAWQAMIRDFMVRHRPTTPLFPEIGRELARFLADHAEDYARWPWIAELADWEFLKITVRDDEADPEQLEADPDGDCLRERPALNPTLRLGQYRWPVHAIAPKKVPEHPSDKPVVLLAWRMRDDRLGMMQINSVTTRLLLLVQENPDLNGLECLERLAREMKHPEPKKLIGHGKALLASLVEKQAILGTRPHR